MFTVAGTDRRVAFTDVAHAAYAAHNLPPDTEPGLQDTAVYDPPNFAFSNGAHVCEIEIDPDTGKIELAGFWAVDDIGTVINPMIVDGQIHGGIAQGVGQAMLEHCAYDEAGQLVSGSFMDYAIARADDLPLFVTESTRASPARTIRSAPRAAARPDRSAHRLRWWARRSMRSAISASPTSKCR